MLSVWHACPCCCHGWLQERCASLKLQAFNLQCQHSVGATRRARAHLGRRCGCCCCCGACPDAAPVAPCRALRQAAAAARRGRQAGRAAGRPGPAARARHGGAAAAGRLMSCRAAARGWPGRQWWVCHCCRRGSQHQQPGVGAPLQCASGPARWGCHVGVGAPGQAAPAAPAAADDAESSAGHGASCRGQLQSLSSKLLSRWHALSFTLQRVMAVAPKVIGACAALR